MAAINTTQFSNCDFDSFTSQIRDSYKQYIKD